VNFENFAEVFKTKLSSIHLHDQTSMLFIMYLLLKWKLWCIKAREYLCIEELAHPQQRTNYMRPAAKQFQFVKVSMIDY